MKVETLKRPSGGSIEVIVGSMYSGKTEELIRRLRRAQYAQLKVQVFKPVIDNRYHQTHVASHNQTLHEATPLTSIHDVWTHLKPETQVVGFDEGQFFSQALIDVSQKLAQQGYRVLIAGLDMDWKGQPFEPIPALMALAEEVTKTRAICMVCGNAATYTQKVRGSSSQIEVGSTQQYEARCRLHFKPEILQPLADDSKLAEIFTNEVSPLL